MSLDAALRNLIAMTGCSLAEALPTVTATPAAAIGMGGSRGQLRPGCHADMVLLSPDLHVVRTIVGGEVVFEAPGPLSD
jgi:N-acetylglucosamine-6-phosphate deacetylase